MKRVVITGLGWNTSLGPDVATTWSRLLAGDTGITPIDKWDASQYSVSLGAAVRNTPGDTGIETLPGTWTRKPVRMFVPAVREAFRHACLDTAPVHPVRLGLAASLPVNYIDLRLLPDFHRAWDRAAQKIDLKALMNGGGGSPAVFHRRSGDTLQTAVAKATGMQGPSLLTDTACAASGHAIGQAFRLLRRGAADVMLAGGSASLVNPVAILAFALLGALSKATDPRQGSRPFDKHRDGFVMGEAAGVVVLETLDSALRRGAKILAELAGYGNTSNAGSLTDPSPGGVSESRAMSLALCEAGLRPEEIDYIAAHGTSTPKNDANETMAIRRAFGRHADRLAVSSNKGQLGHTISAAAVCNVISVTQAFLEKRLPPTMNLHNPDAECDLDYVPNQSRPKEIRAAIANAFAFGGQNAVLALKAWEGR
jgi:3-oxoacyl-[acyl-carrier-protein] synthase II